MGAAGDHPPDSQPRRAAEVVDHRLEKGPFPQGVGPDPVRPAPSLLCPWELQCLALNHRSQTAQPRAVLNQHRIEPAAAFTFQLKMQPLASPGPACCRWRLLRLRCSTACWDPCIKVGSCQPCTGCRTEVAKASARHMLLPCLESLALSPVCSGAPCGIWLSLAGIKSLVARSGLQRLQLPACSASVPWLLGI